LSAWLLSLGRLEEAETQLSLATSLDPLNPVVRFNRGWILFWYGHLPEAEESFRRALQIIAWLERAYARKDEDLYIIKGDPLYRNVVRDPRYTAFLRKMKLPE
jgi:tetratricopeptide (TPR) repeat protein